MKRGDALIGSIPFWPFLIAALSGAVMALQGSVNTSLSKVVGLWEATFIVNLVGTLCSAFLLFGAHLGKGSLLSRAPWYTYLGGLLGVAIIYGVMKSIPPVGVAKATTAIILGQVFTAGLVDCLGLLGMEKMPFNMYRALGTFLMAGGAWLLLRRQ